MRLEVYSKTGCPWCEKAKAFLREKKVAFEEILLDDPKDRQKLYDELKLAGMTRTVPQVILTDYDGERMRIGGWDNLLVSGIQAIKLLGYGQDAITPDGALEIQTRRTAMSTTPTFELLPIDKFAIPTIEFWIEQALAELPPDHPKINSARRRLAEVVAWQEIYGNKTPD